MYYELSPDEQSVLESVAHSLSEDDISYVILRGFVDLPERVWGDDIDIFVHEDDFDAVFGVMEDAIPGDPNRKAPIREQLSVALEDPRESVRRVLSEPKIVIDHLLIRRKHQNLDEPDNKVKLAKFAYGDSRSKHETLRFDVWNHMCYSSPLHSGKYRVDPEIDRLMLRDRVQHNGFYVPSPPDELAHLVGRTVFYYNEDGPPSYYMDRMNELRDTVLSNESQDEKLHRLLKLMFFDAWETAYLLIDERKYGSIRGELEAFSDY
ncbi:hypothetical protein [Natrarchaeobius chitinivorans]|uniref:Uncharacterized protein n=1 Tax=Natrarchaeobius chitinivorans TaxID=1679083 RepID=A0A3N6N232_NATCH|nr:hypothetical protein [Natrarchaeobius chitinivorans]RQG92062.1 hypothetical protein EA473_17535 [Natrarchaeobius chitinivorans]